MEGNLEGMDCCTLGVWRGVEEGSFLSTTDEWVGPLKTCLLRWIGTLSRYFSFSFTTLGLADTF